MALRALPIHSKRLLSANYQGLSRHLKSQFSGAIIVAPELLLFKFFRSWFSHGLDCAVLRSWADGTGAVWLAEKCNKDSTRWPLLRGLVFLCLIVIFGPIRLGIVCGLSIFEKLIPVDC